jgi:hypothetical protein
MVALFGVAVSGGMFVVPLYAFLTTTVPSPKPPAPSRQQNRQFRGDGVLGPDPDRFGPAVSRSRRRC